MSISKERKLIKDGNWVGLVLQCSGRVRLGQIQEIHSPTQNQLDIGLPTGSNSRGLSGLPVGFFSVLDCFSKSGWTDQEIKTRGHLWLGPIWDKVLVWYWLILDWAWPSSRAPNCTVPPGPDPNSNSIGPSQARPKLRNTPKTWPKPGWAWVACGTPGPITILKSNSFIDCLYGILEWSH
jgi:hypothetical protein